VMKLSFNAPTNFLCDNVRAKKCQDFSFPGLLAASSSCSFKRGEYNHYASLTNKALFGNTTCQCSNRGFVESRASLDKYGSTCANYEDLVS